VLNDISGYGGKEAYEEINKVIEEIGDDIANERKKQRVIQVVGGVGLGILGAAAVICTVGAASPIVVAAGVAIGAGTACFAWSEVIEGGGSIYYGSIGDSQTLAFNPIRDTILFGNQDLYNMGKNAFSFAASAIIPFGIASTAGTLTISSAVAVAGDIVLGEVAAYGAMKGVEVLGFDERVQFVAGIVAALAAGFLYTKGLSMLTKSPIGKVTLFDAPKLVKQGITNVDKVSELTKLDDGIDVITNKNSLGVVDDIEGGLDALSTPSSKVLRQNLIDAGVEVPDYPNAAHHIVAGSSPKAAEGRAILQKYGVDINDVANGTFLPTVKDVAEGAYHPSLHTNAYYDKINKLLSEATCKEDVLDILEFIGDELSSGTFMQ